MSSRKAGRDGSSRGGGGGLPRDVQVSKKMSWLLRHNAEKQGLKLGPGGYVNAKDALNTNALRGLHVTFQEMKHAVADNEKQRFSLLPISAAPGQNQSVNTVPGDDSVKTNSVDHQSPDFDQEDPANYLIRANQGHSIKVDDEGLLTPITLEDPSSIPDTVVHGTTYQAWSPIVKTGGLKRMSRNHVHFASGLPPGFVPLEEGDGKDSTQDSATADDSTLPRAKQDPVISGMRSTSTILIYLDLPAALKAGLKFGKSENGVVLTEGDESGLVPFKFFKRVEERKGGYGILVKDGEIVKELPKHASSGVRKGR